MGKGKTQWIKEGEASRKQKPTKEGKTGLGKGRKTSNWGKRRKDPQEDHGDAESLGWSVRKRDGGCDRPETEKKKAAEKVLECARSVSDLPLAQPSSDGLGFESKREDREGMGGDWATRGQTEVSSPYRKWYVPRCHFQPKCKREGAGRRRRDRG